MHNDMKKLSIIIPTYNKPNSLKRLLASCQACINPRITDVIVIHDDITIDPNNTMKQFPFVKAFSTGGTKTGFVNALWRGVLYSNSDMIGFLGDDCELVTPDIDEIIISYKDYQSTIGLNDGISKGRAHPFMWRYWWVSGYGYPPCYTHYYGDTELFKIATMYDRWIFAHDAVIKHHHEYAEKRGQKDINVIEQTISDGKQIQHRDSEIFKRRMQWWEDNNKPTHIPWSIV